MPETNTTVANDSNAAAAAAATANLTNGAGLDTTATSPPVHSGPTINIVDLQNAVKVIDFAAEQGAFKGWQVIKQVMAVRDRLDEFVTATSPQVTDEPAVKVTKKRSRSKQ